MRIWFSCDHICLTSIKISFLHTCNIKKIAVASKIFLKFEGRGGVGTYFYVLHLCIIPFDANIYLLIFKNFKSLSDAYFLGIRRIFTQNIVQFWRVFVPLYDFYKIKQLLFEHLLIEMYLVHLDITLIYLNFYLALFMYSLIF